MMAMTTAGSKRKVLFLHVGGYPHAGNRLSAQRPMYPTAQSHSLVSTAIISHCDLSHRRS
jgi:hypothetical protein